MLGYWDGKSFMGIDFSLHKECGKNKKRPYGLKPSQIKAQYSKERSTHCSGYYREKELFTSKIDNALSMIKRACRKGIMLEYILMDSWYFCEKSIQTVGDFPKKVYIVAMGKMGKSKYEYDGKKYTAKELAHHLQRNKKQRYYRNLNVFVCQAVVHFKGANLKLFFFKTAKRTRYSLMLTNNTKLTYRKTFRIYSIRWSIEVFFKEAKQHFGLGKSQSHDFDAQIADTSISMMQYNIFSIAKRFSAYETLGGLFKETQEKITELTICQKIWSLIMDILVKIALLFEVDYTEMIPKIIVNQEENKILRLIKSNMQYVA